MFKTASRKTWIRSAVAAAALAATAGTASAAQWVGTWDPVYLGVQGDGTPFSGDGTHLYFSGQAVFNTGSCVPTTTSFVLSCPDWKIESAQLVIGSATYNTSTSQWVTSGPFQVMNFTWDMPSSVYNPDINGMSYDAAGNLIGVSADYFLFGVQGNTASTEAFYPGYTSVKQPYFSVKFIGEYAVLGWQLENNPLTWGCTDVNAYTDPRKCGAEEALITFSQPIPEPSTYALMGLGLAAVAAMRRRATRQPKQA